jgi:hypothetical protein
MRKTRAHVVAVNPAGPDHQVVTVEGGNSTYRRTVCAECQWRLDQTGKFPSEAFRHSANTAYDQSMHQFACHMSGSEKPATCAGFLLRARRITSASASLSQQAKSTPMNSARLCRCTRPTGRWPRRMACSPMIPHWNDAVTPDGGNRIRTMLIDHRPCPTHQDRKWYAGPSFWGIEIVRTEIG